MRLEYLKSKTRCLLALSSLGQRLAVCHHAYWEHGSHQVYLMGNSLQLDLFQPWSLNCRLAGSLASTFKDGASQRESSRARQPLPSSHIYSRANWVWWVSGLTLMILARQGCWLFAELWSCYRHPAKEYQGSLGGPETRQVHQCVPDSPFARVCVLALVAGGDIFWSYPGCQRESRPS